MKAKLNIFISILASFALVTTVSLCNVSVAYTDEGSSDVPAVVPAEAPAPAPSTESTPDPGTPAPAQPVAPAPAPITPVAPPPTPAPIEGINHGSVADNANDSRGSGAGAAQNGATGDAQGDTGIEDAVGASAVDGDAVELPDEIEPSVGVLSQPIMPRAYGSCTASSPKVLTTAEDLAGLAKIVNTEPGPNPLAKRCWGDNTSRTDAEVYLKLGNDIDLADWGTYQKGDNSVTEQNWRRIYGSVEDTATATGASDDNANTGGWVPIGKYIDGTDDKPFSGTFDGNGHTISGLKINRQSNYQGLFGYTNTFIIQGLGVIGSNIIGNYHTGGLVGFTSSATITNTYNTGSVEGTNYTGGLVGYAESAIIITNSYNTGSVTGSLYDTGGLVGDAYTAAITNSYNTGSIKGNNSTGGLVGFTSSAAIIQNSFNTGSVEGNEFIGGLVGYASATITNSLSLGKAVKGTNNVGRIWGSARGTDGTSNNYALASMTDDTGTNNCGVQGGKTEADEGNLFGTYATGSYATPIASDKNGANIAWTDIDTATEWTAATLWDGVTSPWTLSNGWKVVEGELPVLAKPNPESAGSFLDEAMPGQDGTPPSHITNPSATSPFAGTGAQVTPYEIGTAYQLAQMACLVNAGDSNYQTSKSWKLTADIDLSDWGTYKKGDNSVAEQNWRGVYGSVEDTATATGALDGNANTGGWVPIGKYVSSTNNKPFSGTFDGNGKMISGLKINRQYNYQGLFGYTNGVTIQGLGIVNSNITGNNYTGGLVGLAPSATTIQNSYNTGSVTGAASTGGLVGAAASSATATITNSYNTGTVTGATNTGGLLGSAILATRITNSYNTGSVTGASSTGGLVGTVTISATTIQNSYNTGSVTGANYTGGLVGAAASTATITNSYNIGSVEGTEYTGGLLGDAYYTANITNSLSLGKAVKGTSDVGRIWGSASRTDGTSNNYALASMTDGTGTNNCGIQGGKTIADVGNKFDSTAADPTASDKNGANIDWSELDTATEWTAVTLWDGVASPWILTNGKLPILAKPDPETAGSFLEDVAMPGQDGTPPSHITDPLATSPFAGTGADSANAYEIGTAYQLAQMACLVNAGDSKYQNDKYWKLTADIDLSDWGTYQFGVSSTTRSNWEKIYGPDTFSLGTDFADLGGGAAYVTSASDQDANTGGWVAIGKYIDDTDDKPFSGTFDGNGKMISGLKINRQYNYQGLFGYTNGVTIRGLGLVNSNITGARLTGGLVGKAESTITITNSYNIGSVEGTEYTGGLVGAASTAIITNSYNTGPVTGTDHTGGLVGGVPATNIQNSYNTGSVEGASYTGGLVGRANSANIQNSYNTGSVTGSRNYTGGLVGIASPARITNSYNTGSVEGASYTGGLLGYTNPTATITNSLSLGKFVKGTNYVGRIWGTALGTVNASNNYALASMTDGTGTNNCGVQGGKTEAVEGNLFGTFPTSSPYAAPTASGKNGTNIAWTGTTPNLSDWTDETINFWLTSLNWNDGASPWILTNGELPVLAIPDPDTAGGFLDEAMPEQDGTPPSHITNPSAFIGIGSETEPYEIDTAYQLAQMACLVNVGDSNYQINKSWKLTADIDLSDWGAYQFGVQSTVRSNWEKIYGPDTFSSGTDFAQLNGGAAFATGASDQNADAGGWVPIGTDSNKFSGIFDGNGKKISGLKINRPTSDDQGLFGRTDTITIQGLGVIGSSVTGNYFTGGLVGRAHSTATIQNSYNTGSVTGSSAHTGGLVGIADSTANITNSYNTGSVTGSNRYTGGLVGYADSTANITNSYNTGSVTGSNSYNTGTTDGNDSTGGLVGRANSTATIQNSFNTGSVTGSSNFTGGLLGSALTATITNSYNTGSVTGASATGGLVGYAYSTNIQNSLSLGKFVKGTTSDVGRIWGYAVASVTASNNYAWGDMKVSTDGSDPTDVIGNEGTDTQTTNGKNGLGVTTVQLIDPDFWLNDSDDAPNFGSIGTCSVANKTTQSECTASDGTWSSTWHIQPNWHPTLNGFGPSTVSGFIAQSAPDTNTTGTQDGTLSLPDNPITTCEELFGADSLKTKICELLGDGSEGNPKQISSAAELATLAAVNNMGGTDLEEAVAMTRIVSEVSRANFHWKLTADIDLTDWGTYQFGVQSTVRSNWEKIYGPDTFSSGTDFTGLNGGAAYVTGASDQDANTGGWVPIGVFSKPFTGNFAGNGHTISGLKINRQSSYQGLFGYTNIITIQGLGVIGSNITGKSYTGGLMGYASSATITNSYNTGSITGSSYYTGGLVGNASTATIANSYNTGSVTGTNSYTGGLVGVADSANITNSYNTGSVTVTASTGGLVGAAGSVNIQNSYNTGSVEGSNYTGGFVGAAYSTATITNSYNTGSVTGDNFTGGLVGRAYTSATITNSLSLGKLVKGTSNVGRIWGNAPSISASNNYAWAAMDVQDSGGAVTITEGEGDAVTTGKNGLGVTTAQLIDPDFWLDDSTGALNSESIGTCSDAGKTTQSECEASNGTWSSTWHIQPNWHPTLNGFGSSTVSGFLAQSAPDTNTTGTQDGSLSLIDNPIATCEELFGADSLKTKICELPGDGSEGNPKQISSAVELATLAAVNNTGGTDLEEAVAMNRTVSGVSRANFHWKLTADIDLTDWGTYKKGDNSVAEQNWRGVYGSVKDTATATGASASDTNTGGWVPIGISSSNKFSGTFNGNGKKISGLKINSSNIAEGLFRYADEISVLNLGMENTDISTTATTDDTGDYGVGSIVGAAYTSISIQNSYNTGALTGTEITGGLVGGAPNATITNSYNTGSVTGTSLTGGLVGIADFATITNSYNTGSVEGTYYTGGLVGIADFATITNSYNTGSVEVVSYAGGLVGIAYSATGGPVGISFSTAIITNSYNTGSVTGAFSTGGLVGYVDSTATIKNSLSLGKFVKSTSDVGRIWGYAGSTVTASNNYAWEDMKVSTDGSEPTDSIGSEGSDMQTVDGQNGLGLEPTDILALFADSSNWSPTDGKSGWESESTDNWYLQSNWLPVLRGFGAPTDTTRTPVAFSGESADTIGSQDGNWNRLFGPFDITYSPGLGTGTPPAIVETDANGVLATVKDFGTGANGVGFTAPTGGTFLYWCKTEPTGTPANICPATDRVNAGATNVSFTADTTLTAVFKFTATVNFSLAFSDRAYNGTTAITPVSSSLGLSANGASATLSDSANLTCEYALDSKNAGPRKVMATCTLTGDDTARFTVSTTAIDTGVIILVSKVNVTVSGISANNKIYDATNSATLSTSGASISGVIASDTVSVTGCQGQFADANASSSKPVTVTNCELTGDDASNYTLSDQPSGLMADITPFALTAQGKVGDYYAIVGDTLDDSNLVQSNYELKNTTTAPETITITRPTVILYFSDDTSCVTTAQNAGIPDCVLQVTIGDATIANSSGADVTANYTLNYSWTYGKLIVRPAKVDKTPTDPDTGVEIEDPSGQLPGNACPSIRILNGTPEFSALDAEITSANELYKAWDIKLVNCNTKQIIDLTHEVNVNIPNVGFKDQTTDFALWHKHFSGANHDVAEDVVKHDASKYNRSGDNLTITTDRLSYFGVSYAAPEGSDDAPTNGDLAGTGINLSRTLLLLLIALLGASAAVRSKAYRVP